MSHEVMLQEISTNFHIDQFEMNFCQWQLPYCWCTYSGSSTNPLPSPQILQMPTNFPTMKTSLLLDERHTELLQIEAKY